MTAVVTRVSNPRIVVAKAARDLAERPWVGDVYNLRRRAGRALARVIRAEFERKSLGLTDAAGISWPPTRAAIREGRRTLIKTRALLQSIEGRPTADGFKIVADRPYAKAVLGKRPAWPTDGKLPEAWWRPVKRVLREGFREIVKRRLAS